ncbi:MAG TPA: helix-turn-helix transcriptional regulator [Mycobacterium sp.]|nr:helix-turn-helix transcriptional regulator [Mycobacterium sp.]
MQYRTYRPAPPLADFVAYMWTMRDLAVHAHERIVPSGTLELVINLNEDALRIYDPGSGVWREYSGAVVSGAYRQYFVIDTRDHASIVGVHFKPGGAWPFLGVPPGELTDRHIDLAMLWGSSAVELRERLCAAPTSQQRFALLEQTLRSCLAEAQPGHPAVPFALGRLARPGVTVGAVAEDVHLSRRRFIQVFTSEVGMTPKRLSRVLRFQRASALARRINAPDWARLARACGYFDQSHLINEVSEFTGTSPSRLRPASESVKELHLAVPDEVKFLQDADQASP